MNGEFDQEKARALLADSLAAVFADMAFIDLAAHRRDGAAIPAFSDVRASIDVLKPISWRIELGCSQALKSRIEETLTQGVESEGEDAGDSMLEMLNVAAGTFLTSYFGSGSAIKLELPHYLSFGEDDSGEMLAETMCDAEGETVRASIRSVRYRY